MRTARYLLPWLDAQTAVSAQLGRLPQPTEDVASLVEKWKIAQAVLASRPPYHNDVALQELPQGFLERAGRISGTALFQNEFANRRWCFTMVDLRNLVAYQTKINTDCIQLGEDQIDPIRLFELCLPETVQWPSVSMQPDQHMKSMTFVSENPNLRVFQMAQGELVSQTSATAGSERLGLTAQYALTLGTPWIQVAELRGRFLLSNGYHRALALLQRQINIVPCILVHAENYVEAGVMQPTFLAESVTMGDRPPTLSDFLDERFTITVHEPSMRKVIQITAQEILVPVDSNNPVHATNANNALHRAS